MERRKSVSNSLFDKIGGQGAVNAAIDIFYRKVIADERINKFFIGIDMKVQSEKQKGFLTMALGGPNNYSGKKLREGHSYLVSLGLNDEHFNAVVDNLGLTLEELEVAVELIEEVKTLLESTRNDVLNR